MIPPGLGTAAAAVAGAAAPAAPPVERAEAGCVHVDGTAMVNMASCDYLALSRHPLVLAAAHRALDEWGLGTGAGRVLSGSTVLHRRLEERLAAWVGCEDAVLHGSCWSANAAVFGVLAVLAERAGGRLAVFSDRLNHASIIDAVRAQRPSVGRLELYDHGDPDGLRRLLGEARGGDLAVIVTDGVFSMEGDNAPLGVLRGLAEEHGAVLVVDDSHGTGVAGATGRGTAEATGVLGRVDLVTGTLGKAIGGAIGGFVAGPQSLTAAVRALSRPYVFSNNPPTPVVAGALAALDVLAEPDGPLPVLRERVRWLRRAVAETGLRTLQGDHPIVPVLIGDEERARAAAAGLREAGVYATALAHPIVPRGTARLRLQVSAAHDEQALIRVLDALVTAAV